MAFLFQAVTFIFLPDFENPTLNGIYFCMYWYSRPVWLTLASKQLTD